jgi:hypothetical protein
VGLIVTLIGLLLIGLVVFDFLVTTIGAASFSPISKCVARGAFAVVRRFPDGDLKHRLSGVAVMTAIATWWIVGHASGWTLVFAGVGHAVVNSDTQSAASLIGIASHVGHLLSTVGGGVTEPRNAAWSLLGVLVGVNGMVVLTLSVSFVLSTTQTVARGRALLTKVDVVSHEGEHDDRMLLFEVADLVAMLNAAPFALYYSAADAERRLPSGLTKLMDDWPPSSQGHLRTILDELPWLELSGNQADVASEFRSWAARYSASPGQ